MRGLVVVFVYLWAVVRSSHDVEMTVTECEEGQCECAPSRGPSMFRQVYNEDLGCYCFCGSHKSEECRKDVDCVRGLHCAAGHVKGGHGQCEDACKKPGFSCSIFDKCQIGDGDEPVCVCKLWQCSDLKIGHGVCAFDPVQNKHVTFNNDCLFENARCQLRMDGQEGLERLEVHECAAVVERYPHPGEQFDGFQFETLF